MSEEIQAVDKRLDEMIDLSDRLGITLDTVVERIGRVPEGEYRSALADPYSLFSVSADRPDTFPR